MDEDPRLDRRPLRRPPRTLPPRPTPPFLPPTVQDRETYGALRGAFERHGHNPSHWMLPPMSGTAQSYTLSNYEPQLRALSERLQSLASGTADLLTPKEADYALLVDLAHHSDFHRIQLEVACYTTGTHTYPGAGTYTRIVWNDEADEEFFAGIAYNLRHHDWAGPCSTTLYGGPRSRSFPGDRVDAAVQNYFLYFQPLPQLPPLTRGGGVPMWIPFVKLAPTDPPLPYHCPAYLPWSIIALLWMNRLEAPGLIGPHLPETYPDLISRFPGLRIRRAEWPDHYTPDDPPDALWHHRGWNWHQRGWH